MTLPTFFVLADCVDPSDPQGRTYRQVNAAKTHSIPLGALVELSDDSGDPDSRDGVRLFVVHHARDCDQTPLYAMSARPDERLNGERFYPTGWVTGWPEGSLTVIRLPQS